MAPMPNWSFFAAGGFLEPLARRAAWGLRDELWRLSVEGQPDLPGDERARLCFLPGGYGRMTVPYDRVVRVINEYLLGDGGPGAGSVQRFGAGWGGNVGGLVRRDYV